MGQFGIGQPVRRTEDPRFLTGRGRYIDDIVLPRQLHGHVLRSPHAHARLGRIDTAAAAAMPGVRLILTGVDLEQAHIGTIPCLPGLEGRDGKPYALPPRRALALDRVRHVGDAVAFVVADTSAQARDAAEAIEAEYDPLPAVTATASALRPGSPRVWGEVPGNLCLDWEQGDAKAVAAAFAKAAHVTRLELVNNRVVVASMEPRGAIGAYDPAEQRFTLYTSSQGSNLLRDELADEIFHLPRDRFRVVTPDVGGGFGMKMPLYGEQILVLFAARALGQPVRWIPDRSEAFLSDNQGRDHVSEAALALDEDGRFLALQVSTIANMGAYLSGFAPYVPTIASVPMFSGLYALPAIHAAIRCVFTNTCPVDAYRGAGRPEASYLVERMVDLAAREIGLSPIEIRRRNFVAADRMPYTTAIGPTYDSGDFARVLAAGMKEADWDGFARRREEAKARGRRRGIGVATYIEQCGGGLENPAELRIETDGSATLLTGAQSSGQGHATAFAQIVSEGLGLAADKVRVVQGDTDQIPFGSGTAGSCTMPVAGNAVRAAVEKMVRTCKRWAASLLEAAEADIEVEEGRFRVAGTDRSVSLTEIAAAAYDLRRQADGLEFGLAERGMYKAGGATYPNGCHVAEVEIDTATGWVDLCAYTIVDDFGVVLNPLLLEGQVHGGTAQGAGQALFEESVYDPDSGQLLTGSFMDYRMPRAADMPMIRFATENIPCKTNPMGVKGAGEAGAIGAPPAIINAVVDALAEFGITHIDMPATPERIWRAIQAARAGR